MTERGRRSVARLWRRLFGVWVEIEGLKCCGHSSPDCCGNYRPFKQKYKRYD